MMSGRLWERRFPEGTAEVLEGGTSPEATPAPEQPPTSLTRELQHTPFIQVESARFVTHRTLHCQLPHEANITPFRSLPLQNPLIQSYDTNTNDLKTLSKNYQSAPQQQWITSPTSRSSALL